MFIFITFDSITITGLSLIKHNCNRCIITLYHL